MKTDQTDESLSCHVENFGLEVKDLNMLHHESSYKVVRYGVKAMLHLTIFCHNFQRHDAWAKIVAV